MNNNPIDDVLSEMLIFNNSDIDRSKCDIYGSGILHNGTVNHPIINKNVFEMDNVYTALVDPTLFHAQNQKGATSGGF